MSVNVCVLRVCDEVQWSVCGSAAPFARSFTLDCFHLSSPLHRLLSNSCSLQNRA